MLTSWPGTGDRVYPFLSSVDNGWLGAALMVVQLADRGAAPLADRLFDRMRWDMFYDADAAYPVAGGPDPRRLLRRAAAQPRRHLHRQPHRRRPRRLVHQAPLRHDRLRDPDHVATSASSPARSRRSTTSPCGAPSRRAATGPGTRCSRSAQTRTYLGLDVYEGAYTYRGMHIVPGWGGSMFEELMPDVFVPEASWAPRSLGRQPPAARAGPARARPRSRPATATGASRRRATPSPATASTASTPSA